MASTDGAGKQPTILEKIYAQRAKDVELAKSTPGTTPDDLVALLGSNVAPTLIPVVERLKRNPSTTLSSSTLSPSLMAEIKRASPSKGPIALTTNPAQQALTYALSGASVISVLTEPTWFKGSLLDLRLVRQAVDALPDRPAILRKEFILDEYQIMEARLHGADTILIIVAMLSQERVRALYSYSLSLGMEPCVEVNNASEMTFALELGAKIIGVNNRNLHDFNVDMGTTSRLADMVRERDVILCAFSGISNSKDIDTYKEQGVRAVLIGEALMRAKNTATFIRELLDWPTPPLEKQEKTWIIASGVTSLEQALEQVKNGANVVGVSFTKDRNTYGAAIATASAIDKHLDEHRVQLSKTEKLTPSAIAPWFTAQKRQLLSTKSPLLMGAFSNCSLEDIIHAVTTARLDLVMLDHTSPAGWSKHVPVPVVRRFHTSSQGISKPGEHAFILVEPVSDTSEMERYIAELEDLVDVGEAPGWPLSIICSGLTSVGDAQKVLGRVKPWAIEIDLSKSGKILFNYRASWGL